MSDTSIQVVNTFEISIGTGSLPDKLQAALTMVEVEQRLNAPSSATLSFHDTAIEGESVMDDAALALGTALKVSAASTSSNRPEPLFEGEITSVDFEVEGGASYVTVTAHSKLHHLYHGTNFDTKLATTYSDIVSALARQADLSPQVDATSEQFKHVPQAWISNAELLEALAAEIGYVFYSWDATLHFKKPTWSAASGVTVTHGDDLLRFRSSSSTAPAAKKVEVRSWDPMQKKEIIGKADTVSANGVKLAADPAKAYDKDATYVTHVPHVPTPAAAGALAKALADRIGDAASHAEGLCRGNPKIVPGKTIKVDKVPNPVKGDYYVTTARHVFLDGEYHTDFRCSGASPTSLHALAPASPAPRPALQTNPVGMVVLPGIVTQNKHSGADGDHTKQHVPAVKVKFPMLADDKESDWYRVVQPGAGDKRGMLFMPEVNDEVLVAFAGGDMRVGYVLGGLFNGKDLPGEELGDAAKVVPGNVELKGFVSRGGHQVILDDTGGQERILIKNKKGAQLLFTSQDEKILVQTKNEKVELDGGGSKINVESDGDITIKAKGKINLEATGDIVLKSSANLKAEATANLEMKGTGGAKLESSAQTEVKGGAMAKVDGGAMTEIKGGLVKIN